MSIFRCNGKKKTPKIISDHFFYIQMEKIATQHFSMDQPRINYGPLERSVK